MDDDTPPPGQAHLMFEHIPPIAYGIAAPGFSRIILGGGNLDFCMVRAFESLVRQKIIQNESLETVIPLAMTYYSEDIRSPIEYVLKSNPYSRHLQKQFEEGHIGNYTIWVDGQVAGQRTGSGPSIELKWFTVLMQMFASPIFPEINDSAALARVFARFRMK